MNEPYQVLPDIFILPYFFNIPGIGMLPANAFVLLAKEPVLVDTGVAMESESFLKALQSIIAPSDIKWIWLTHDDSDHTGSLERVMELAPRARVLTHALGAIRMSLSWPLPLERIYAIGPDERIDVGDRRLTAVKPPVFDNPSTLGFYDDKSRVFFCADCFGAILPGQGTDAAGYPEKDLTMGMTIWATFDSSWVHLVHEEKYGKVLESIRQMAPSAILSSHLPPAHGITDRLLKVLASLPGAQPFVAPNQAAFGQIVAQLRGKK
jgi:glyoxylase-like metal-dependent hydrolase (beta-lactamase superfamily II)